MKVHSFELDSEKHSLVVDNEELNSIGVETKSKQAANCWYFAL